MICLLKFRAENTEIGLYRQLIGSAEAKAHGLAVCTEKLALCKRISLSLFFTLCRSAKQHILSKFIVIGRC
jgi:hypothetical protein